MSDSDNIEQKKPSGGPESEVEEDEYFYPHEVVKFIIIIVLLAGLAAFLATVVPMPVGEKANPAVTPPGIEPEWYFLPVYELLKYVPRWVGIGFSMIAFPILLIVLPFLWRFVAKWRWGRLVLNTGVGVIVVAVTLALVANQASRSETAAGPADGHALYQQECASCHGSSGELLTGETSLVESPNRTDAAFVLEAVNEGVGTMPPVPLSEKQAEAIAEYVASELGGP